MMNWRHYDAEDTVNELITTQQTQLKLGDFVDNWPNVD